MWVWRGREMGELGGVEDGETTIRIYCTKNESIFNKKEKGKRKRNKTIWLSSSGQHSKVRKHG